MRHPSRLIAIAIVAVTALHAATLTRGDPQANSRAAFTMAVPLVRILAVPEKFDGHSVRTVGFCQLEFEGTALYMHEDDARRRITTNAIWLTLDESQVRQYAQSCGRYAVVEATFSADDNGHLNLFSGSFKSVRAIRPWNP